MQYAAGLGQVGGDAGEEEAEFGVGVDQAAFPAVGKPTTHLPRQARQTVGVVVIAIAATIHYILLHAVSSVVT